MYCICIPTKWGHVSSFAISPPVVKIFILINLSRGIFDNKVCVCFIMTVLVHLFFI